MATNLLGLVNQLQHMENTFVSVLIEAALKLTALTETNVFVLVEAGDSRRFAGSPHLCESYATSTLTPIGNDVQVSLRESLPNLTETPLLPPVRLAPSSSVAAFDANVVDYRHSMTSSINAGQNFGSAPRPTPRSISGSPAWAQPPNRKRTHPMASSESCSSPAKASKTFPADDMKLEVAFDEKPNVDAINGNEVAIASSAANDFNPSSPNGSDDSDIIFDDEILAEDAASSGNVIPGAISSVEQPNLHLKNFGQEDQWIVDKFLRENGKARALSNVDVPDVTEKNSTGYKLLCSLVYDLGKLLGAHFQGDKQTNKQLFDRVVVHLLTVFPNVAKYQDSPVGGFRTLKMLVRSRLQQAACKVKPRS